MKNKLFFTVAAIVAAVILIKAEWSILGWYYGSARQTEKDIESTYSPVAIVEAMPETEAEAETTANETREAYEATRVSAWDIIEAYVHSPEELADWCAETEPGSVIEDADSAYIELLASARKTNFELRRKAMETSRTGSGSPKTAWGEFLKKDTEAIGSEEESFVTLIYENGIVVKVAGKYFFFHKITLKSMPKAWSKGKVIAVESTDGYWLPAMAESDGTIQLLTEWGEIASNDVKKAF